MHPESDPCNYLSHHMGVTCDCSYRGGCWLPCCPCCGPWQRHRNWTTTSENQLQKNNMFLVGNFLYFQHPFSEICFPQTRMCYVELLGEQNNASTGGSITTGKTSDYSPCFRTRATQHVSQTLNARASLVMESSKKSPSNLGHVRKMWLDID